MKRKIKVMLVEDNPEYRHVISFSLEDDDNLELISQFGAAEQALRSLQNMATRKVPDVILLDLNLPGMTGIDALPEFTKQSPQSKTIVLTQSQNEADVLAAIQQGAAGYLLKSSSVQEIKAGIQHVMEGGAPLDPMMAQYILNNFPKASAPTESAPPLSERELEILTFISKGMARKEISQTLSISTKTVDNHIAHIFEKLEVPNAPAAINKAHRLGLFPSADD